jgi:hypothetical protein
MPAENAKGDCRFSTFFVIFAAKGFGITGGTAPRLSPTTFRLRQAPRFDTICAPVMKNLYLHRIRVLVGRVGVFAPSPVWREPAS